MIGRLAVVSLIVVAFVCAQTREDTKPRPRSEGDSTFVAVHSFEASRDASADVQRAIVEARKTGRRILLDIGGDWCPWCHSLDQLFQQHPELVEVRDQNFVTVAIYYGPDNKNEQLLSQYSKPLGIPHFFVLNTDGTLVHSQHVAELREDGNYSPEKIRNFLTTWSKASTEPPTPAR